MSKQTWIWNIRGGKKRISLKTKKKSMIDYLWVSFISGSLETLTIRSDSDRSNANFGIVTIENKYLADFMSALINFQILLATSQWLISMDFFFVCCAVPLYFCDNFRLIRIGSELLETERSRLDTFLVCLG